MPPATTARFCHRGPPPAVVSPGAVSRFGLAPVHGDRHEFDLRFVGTATTSFELCNFDTTRGHTPRILATSLVRPDRKAGSRCPRVPTDLRRWRGAASDVPMSPSARTLRCHLLGSTSAGMTSSRGPSREGRDLAPARRCPEHLVVTDFDHVAFGETRVSCEAGRGSSHAIGLTRCTAGYPPCCACREATRPT